MIIGASILLWRVKTLEDRKRRTEQKELTHATSIFQWVMIGIYGFVSCCWWPISPLAPFPLFIWGIILMVGIVSFFVGIGHILYTLYVGKSMSEDQITRGAVAWPRVWIQKGRSPTLYSQFFFYLYEMGLFLLIIGGGGFVLEISKPRTVPQQLPTFLVFFLGGLLLGILIENILIPFWRKRTQ